MRYILVLVGLLVIVVSAGCVDSPANLTDNLTDTTVNITTTIETTVETTINQTNITTTTTIKLGEECTDSDGGLVYDVKGTATFPRAPVTISLTKAADKCVSNVTLQEYYCEPVANMSYSHKITGVKHTCENGCYNGACVD